MIRSMAGAASKSHPERSCGRRRWRRAGQLAATICLLSSSATLAETDQSGLVLGAQTHFSQGWDAGLVDSALKIGARSLRDSVPWSSVEKAPGQYVFDAARLAPLHRFCAAGGSLLLTEVPRNRLYDAGLDVSSPAGRRAYATFVARLLNEFGRCVVGIEVGNEINGANGLKFPPSVDPVAGYISILNELRPVVQGRDPHVAIIGGSTNEIGTGFLARLFAGGMLPLVDGIAVHPYRAHAETVDLEIRHLEQVMAGFHRKVPIWATEFSNNYPTAAAAAPELVKMAVLLDAAHLPRAYWYALRDQAAFQNMGLYDSHGYLKPAGAAFQFVQEQLLPYGPPTRLATDGTLFAYRFGRDRLVIWGAERPFEIAGRARYFNAVGQPIAPPASITPSPVIVVGASGLEAGPANVLADSLTGFGEAPWSYLASKSGAAERLGLFDDRYTSYFGARDDRPLRINMASAAPAGDGAHAIDAVIRYTAPTSGRLVAAACFRKSPGGDGVTVALRVDDRVLKQAVVVGPAVALSQSLTVRQGEAIDWVIGPNQQAGHDGVKYRLRMLRAVEPATQTCQF